MQRHRLLTGFLAGAVAAAALTTAGTAIAGAARSERAACTRMWAVVNTDGSLARASCQGIHSRNKAVGAYIVTFPRNVRRCAYVATAGEAGHSGAAQAADISVQGSAGSRNAVFVAVYSAPSTGVDEGFHLIVEC